MKNKIDFNKVFEKVGKTTITQQKQIKIITVELFEHEIDRLLVYINSFCDYLIKSELKIIQFHASQGEISFFILEDVLEEQPEPEKTVA